jgi:hypothetical protein
VFLCFVKVIKLWQSSYHILGGRCSSCAELCGEQNFYMNDEISQNLLTDRGPEIYPGSPKNAGSSLFFFFSRDYFTILSVKGPCVG